MAASFFFYDLETSGFDARSARIMQFAGQRTDMELQPIGEPVNFLIKLTSDVLPDPDAVLITGITPQMTLENGITEAEFLRHFEKEICVPDTIFTGFNSIRFDDEFMRHLFWRNFYDAYRWQWCDGCSRWDILDVVRMTRALRPEGIKWPFGSDGAPSNRLELLTSVNGLAHENAHDALEDVNATIAMARLLREKQPKLFDYLLDMRDKKKVGALVEAGQPFIYTSGAYSSEHHKTTLAVMIVKDFKNQGAFVYDLRTDPEQFAKMSTAQLAKLWRWRKDRNPDDPKPPVKLLRYNRCPAVAPMSVLDKASQERLQLNMTAIKANRQKLTELPDFSANVAEAYKLMDGERVQGALLGNGQAVDAQLYDGFLDKRDEPAMAKVRQANAETISELEPAFHDTRLNALLPLYKARNFPDTLNAEERTTWEAFRKRRLLDGGQSSRLARYMQRLQSLVEMPGMTKNKRFLLEELQLYAESIVPTEEDL